MYKRIPFPVGTRQSPFGERLCVSSPSFRFDSAQTLSPDMLASISSIGIARAILNPQFSSRLVTGRADSVEVMHYLEALKMCAEWNIDVSYDIATSYPDETLIDVDVTLAVVRFARYFQPPKAAIVVHPPHLSREGVDWSAVYEAVHTWIHAWERNRHRPALTIRGEADELTVTDSFSEHAKQLTLSGESAVIYRSCMDSAQSTEAIARRTGIWRPRIHHALQGLRELGLLFSFGDKHLTLAVQDE